jgi:hypothetical protein
MNHFNLLVAAAIPAICVGYFLISCQINKKATDARDSAPRLVVLSGMLAALAILIPLGATLLPEKNFPWPASLLVGALLMSAFCMFGVIYSMISLQDKAKFIPKDFLYVPSWINATWFALVLLAFTCVAVKAFPAPRDASADSTGAKAQVRFVIARDLPELGASRQEIETTWGAPAQEKDSELLYRTKDGVIVFCLDTKGISQTIAEVKESDANAVRTYCSSN